MFHLLNHYFLCFKKYSSFIEPFLPENFTKVFIKKETKETDSKIQRAKDECKELGFTKGTEKFGDCVMKMLSM